MPKKGGNPQVKDSAGKKIKPTAGKKGTGGKPSQPK